MAGIFYKPANAWAADFIPFYEDGRFRLFYLHDWRNITVNGEGTPWYQISTSDLVHFEEHGQMLARGTREEQDLYVFTGSVIQALGKYHIFYTGHNPWFRKSGKPEQGVMHAVSDDLINWHKLPEDTHFAPQDHYEMHDWRDPFVFWNPDAGEGEYWMLLAARLKTGPSRRRGCTALCVSRDLKEWEVRDPIYAPGLYYTHECPDLFKIGDWWYLVFSEFSEQLVTRYRMARSLAGPWIAPTDDQFDGRAFYAAKTASDGRNRFLFGWNPTRERDKDYGSWHWGGNLVVHQIAQRGDGTLRVHVPLSVDHAFGIAKPQTLQQALGKIDAISDGQTTAYQLDGTGTFACATGALMTQRFKLMCDVIVTEGTRSAGIMLRVSDDLEKAYYIRLEPLRNRLVFDMWPRPGDVPYMSELERPLNIVPGNPIQIRVYIEETLCEVYVNDDIAMSTRLYDLAEGNWGVFVENGIADFRNVTVSSNTATVDVARG